MLGRIDVNRKHPGVVEILITRPNGGGHMEIEGEERYVTENALKTLEVLKIDMPDDEVKKLTDLLEEINDG